MRKASLKVEERPNGILLMDNCEEASCDRDGKRRVEGRLPVDLMCSVKVSSESFAALDGVSRLARLRPYPV